MPATHGRLVAAAIVLSALVGTAIVLSALALSGGCQRNPAVAIVTPVTTVSQWPFREVAAEVGLNFQHFNGMSGEWYMCEMTGGGGALFDYDNDGNLDLFVVQGAMLGPGKTLANATFPPADGQPPRCRLYHNDLVINADGSRTLHFTDVTDKSGIDIRDYCMGAAAGDFDNDGYIDLYVTTFHGGNHLLHNNGNGTFTDITVKAGVSESRWSSSAAWVDYDHDGLLDLFVCNYLRMTYQNHHMCHDLASAPDYCGPTAYEPETSRLFHNRGDGTFEDVSVRSGIAAKAGPALGVVALDLNGDGLMDIYVANDGMPNHAWVNQGNGIFREQAMEMGCAMNSEGQAEAGMGVAVGDFDNDGLEDLCMTNLRGEKLKIYRNLGGGLFSDVSLRAGLRGLTRPYTGFGVGFLDFDNDGWLDLFAANGEVRVIEEQRRAGDPYPLRQPKKLYRNLGNGRFEEVDGGPALALPEVGRGVAFGDLDNDGGIDVVVFNNNGPLRVFLNQVGGKRHWIGLRLVGPDGRRDMLGARAILERPAGPKLLRHCHTDGSYCSSNDPRVLFGLGDDPRVDRILVRWPNGQTEQWTKLQVDRYTTLRQGTGDQVKHE